MLCVSEPGSQLILSTPRGHVLRCTVSTAQGHPACELGWSMTLTQPLPPAPPVEGPGTFEPHPARGASGAGTAPLPDPGRPAPGHATPAPHAPWPRTSPHVHTPGAPRVLGARRLVRAGVPVACARSPGRQRPREGPGLLPASASDPARHRGAGAHWGDNRSTICGLALLRAPSQTGRSRPAETPCDFAPPPAAPQPPALIQAVPCLPLALGSG